MPSESTGNSHAELAMQSKKRRKLCTRRQLRHKGTYVVRVGSANVLQTNRGPYSFDVLDETKEEDSSGEADEQPLTVDSPSPPSSPLSIRSSKPPPVMHSLTQMAEKARHGLKIYPKPGRNGQSTFTSGRSQSILHPSMLKSYSPRKLTSNTDRSLLSSGRKFK